MEWANKATFGVLPEWAEDKVMWTITLHEIGNWGLCAPQMMTEQVGLILFCFRLYMYNFM